MLDAGYWMLDLRCLPGGIFAVAGNILMLDIGCWIFVAGRSEAEIPRPQEYWMVKIYSPLEKLARGL